ncbi:MAG: 50S ribosomal protein L4 [Nitrospiraceae bacterium]|nr:50S ribosomal protein L4 [Nitrospiraceae bacterium]
MELKVCDEKNNEVSTVNLSGDICEFPLKREMISDVVRWQLARRRQGTHATKTRGEVRGGGRKPWAQKHTGRARQGSIRSPQWVGGGIVFGPQPRDYSFNIPKKVRKSALKSVFAARLNNGSVHVIEHLAFDKPKTSQALDVLNNLNLKDKTVLIVMDGFDKNSYLSFRNLPNVKVIDVQGINVYDMLAFDVCLFTKSALSKLIERLSR